MTVYSSIITDGSGTVVRNISYQPWGNVHSNTEESGASTFDPSRKFTGQILDDSTELYYYGARYYDPTIRRFITPDTIVQSQYDPQSLNRYAYCRNNPLIYKDPSGHFFWFAVGAMAMYNAFENSDKIHNFGDFAKYAGIGAAEGALMYWTGGAGAAGAGRVTSQLATTMLMKGANSMMGNPMGKLNTGGQIATYILASAMIQGGLEHGMYKNDLQGFTEDELKEIGTTNASREDYITKMNFEDSEEAFGGRQLYKLDARSWQKVIINGEYKGIVGRASAFGNSPLLHTASASVKGSAKGTKMLIGQYLWNEGVCHQSVAQQFWNSGLQVSPTQLYGTWDTYLTTGVLYWSKETGPLFKLT